MAAPTCKTVSTSYQGSIHTSLRVCAAHGLPQELKLHPVLPFGDCVDLCSYSTRVLADKQCIKNHERIGSLCPTDVRVSVLQAEISHQVQLL